MRRTIPEKILTVLNTVILAVIGLVTAIPFIDVISTSFAPEKEVLAKGMVLFPKTGISLDTYKFILKAGSGIPNAYLVTMFETIVGTILSLLITSMLAYGLTKRNMPGRKAISFAILFTMLFNGGLIPTYMIVKSVGLIDSLWSMILPSLVSVWNMLVLVSFFETIPESIEESALIDGCNEIAIFIKIILPLSIPALTTIGLFYAVFYWNQWFAPVIYINNSDKWPLQVLLRQVLLAMDFNAVNGAIMDTNITPPSSTSIKTATIVVTMLPILLVYPFIQKHFIKGVMIGAVKG